MYGANPQNSNNELEERELKRKMDLIISNILTKNALQRINNVKIVNEDLAYNVMTYIVQLYNTGKINVLDDDGLKKILQKYNNMKKDIKIIRK